MSTSDVSNSSNWKTVDGRCRVTLPKVFKGKPVILRKLSNTKYEVELAEVVPASEAWLHKNAEALSSVMKGIDEAGSMEFAESEPKIPDLSELD